MICAKKYQSRPRMCTSLSTRQPQLRQWPDMYRESQAEVNSHLLQHDQHDANTYPPPHKAMRLLPTLTAPQAFPTRKWMLGSMEQ